MSCAYEFRFDSSTVGEKNTDYIVIGLSGISVVFDVSLFVGAVAVRFRSFSSMKYTICRKWMQAGSVTGLPILKQHESNCTRFTSFPLNAAPLFLSFSLRLGDALVVLSYPALFTSVFLGFVALATLVVYGRPRAGKAAITFRTAFFFVFPITLRNLMHQKIKVEGWRGGGLLTKQDISFQNAIDKKITFWNVAVYVKSFPNRRAVMHSS